MKYAYGHPTITKNPLVRNLLLAFGILVAIALSIWFGVEQWYQTALEPKNTSTAEVIFPVTPGMSTVDVATELEEVQLIRNATAFVWYLGRQGDVAIQAGTYRLNAGLSTPEIADMLINGEIDTSLLTIPSGLRLDELVEKTFINAGYDPGEVEAALSHRYDSAILANKPSQASLEGYVFPETFQIAADSTPQQIIQRALDEFSRQLTPAIRQGISQQGLTLHEAVILASIIQKEASGVEDQRKVAQVFLKRLDEDMVLGADATFRYAAAVTGQEVAVDLESEYNTRIHGGLPPGPIANFELSALEAVANPADTDFLYFVHGDDCFDSNLTGCTTYFAKTLAEHEANAAKYCRRNCQL